MVGISSGKGPIAESPERIALVLTVLGNHKRFAENTTIVFLLDNRFDFEASFWCKCKVIIDQFLVIYAPGTTIAKLTVSGFYHRKIRIEESL